MDKINDARRHTSLFESANKCGCGERRKRRRLQNGGVAGNQRRRKLPYRNRNWKIPRADQTDYAKRLGARIAKHTVLFGREHTSGEPASHACGVLQDVNRSLQFSGGFRQYFPFLTSEQVSELILMSIHPVEPLEEQPATFGWIDCIPRLGGFRSRINSPSSIGSGRIGGAGHQHRPIGGVVAIGPFVGLGRLPLSADKIKDGLTHFRSAVHEYLWN